MLTHYVALGQNVWGKAETIKEAVKNARSQSRRAGTRFIVYHVPADASVNALGYLTWGDPEVEPRQIGLRNTQGNPTTTRGRK